MLLQARFTVVANYNALLYELHYYNYGLYTIIIIIYISVKKPMVIIMEESIRVRDNLGSVPLCILA